MWPRRDVLRLGALIAAGGAIAPLTEPRERSPHIVQGGFEARDETRARFGQADTARGALQQPNPDTLLEGAHGLAHRGGSDA